MIHPTFCCVAWTTHLSPRSGTCLTVKPSAIDSRFLMRRWGPRPLWRGRMCSRDPPAVFTEPPFPLVWSPLAFRWKIEDLGVVAARLAVGRRWLDGPLVVGLEVVQLESFSRLGPHLKGGAFRCTPAHYHLCHRIPLALPDHHPRLLGMGIARVALYPHLPFSRQDVRPLPGGRRWVS